jgi:hypothetical protein
MRPLEIVGGAAGLLLMIACFWTARRRVRARPENNWTNEACIAREQAGSWSENECAVGHEGAAPPCVIPGVR